MRVGSRRAALASTLLIVAGVAGGCAQPSPPPGIQPETQVFAGSTVASTTPALCSGAEPIRTVTFTKKSATSRLRITYKDTASAFSNKGGGLFVLGRIDGVAVSNPTGLRMAFGNVPSGTNFFTFYSSFSLVGYADGVDEGSHGIDFVYATQSLLGATFSCSRDSEPFLIEIVET